MRDIDVQHAKGELMNCEIGDANRDRERTGPSNKSFGLTFAAVFAIVAVLPLFSSQGVAWWAAGAAALLAAISLSVPEALAGANRAWMKAGGMLHRITSPIVLGILYFLVISPIGLIMRLSGRDALQLKLDKRSSTYWVKRTVPGPKPESMKNQF